MTFPKCREYIENFLKIRTKDAKVIPLRLNPPQERLYKTFAKAWNAGKPVRIIILKARQMGFSTLCEAILFYLAATSFHRQSMIVAHTEDSTSKLFEMSKRYYDYLPDPIKPAQRASNARELVFDRAGAGGLGSSIRCATAGGKGIGRSFTLQCLHLSEYAFWTGDKQATFTGLVQAVPDKPGTVILIESTANGYDDFKTKWDAAVKAQREGVEGYIPIFFAWFEMPEYRREVPPSFVRTAEEEELAAAFGLCDEQLAWRRWCIDNNCGGDVQLFRQEYPSTPDEAFISTGTCVFDKAAIVRWREEVRKQVWQRGEFRVLSEGLDGTPIHFTFAERADGPIRIRKHPEKRVPYVIGGDTAGEGSDYFCGQVLDNRTGEQVAVLHHQYGEREYARQMYCLGRYYNDALIGVETNYSTYPEKKLEDMRYPKLYVREKVDTYAKGHIKSFGFDTNAKTRPLMIDNLRDVAQNCPENITDYETLGEMLTFVYDKHRRPAADVGAHDDLVMALAIAHQIRGQQSHALADEAIPWTRAMWEDYDAASTAERQDMIRRWGVPRARGRN